ncbi:TetR family transcriptional regulator [Planosporangium mesophilum]|uniref:TetR family transcriptional regulator n=2 Tax=Planosporangium mesophilum TaxID=689768 RepID=A0A8J3TL57_9ACTN|nr:TetR/AcrR family transcriptional regulator [Planosporangium mesophilum]NJC84484.1 TetR/AcrR family transcriptional regulator [Planosporangium mesophilum]GII23370.1 TetR family transcriptional regulator [Planosporangium mesophilum]
MIDDATQRPGGRTARVRAAVLTATLQELAQRGYAGMSVESVAQRAGVHKTTVYRRWATKPNLLMDAIATLAETKISVPDTGDLAEDLRSFARTIATTITGHDGGAVVRGLFSGATESSEVRDFLHGFWAGRFAQVRPMVERAIGRGELPTDTDADEVIKHVGAPLYYRLLVTAEAVTSEAAELAADSAVAAARAGVFRRRRPSSGD